MQKPETKFVEKPKEEIRKQLDFQRLYSVLGLEDTSENRTKIEDRIKEYWTRRLKNIRTWCLVMSTSNLVFEIKQIVDPLCPEERITSIIKIAQTLASV
jgi:hypothetical protein